MPISADGFYDYYTEQIREDARRIGEAIARHTTYVERPPWQQRFGWLVRKWRHPIRKVDWDAYDAEIVSIVLLDEEPPNV